MNVQNPDPAPLPYGQLAPDFELHSVSGDSITRHQFRNQKALVLIFFQDFLKIKPLLEQISKDMAEYVELNARVLGIGQTTAEALAQVASDLPFTLLADPDGKTTRRYLNIDSGYGVFALDIYGGVDSQKVTATARELPDAATILEWIRGAQYRCNI
jgi:peroxiredoxin